MYSIARLAWLVIFLALTPVCFGHGDMDELIEKASTAIADQPANAALRLRRAELHRLHGDGPAAELDYEATRRLQPGLTVVDLGLAELRMAQGRDAEALVLFGRFLEDKPGHAEARRERAALLEKRGDWQAASNDLALAVQSSSEPHYASARAALLVRHEQIDEAIRCLDQASLTHGGLPVLEQRALEIEERHGRPEQALRRIDRLVAHQLRPDLWLARKARLLEKAGRTTSARQAWGEAKKAFEKVPPEKRGLELNRRIQKEIKQGTETSTSSPQ